ncbi:MAG: thioredoxin family protein [Synechococcales bacterium]|nr:thioredoxin family protein [Synechococcales bacterium]
MMSIQPIQFIFHLLCPISSSAMTANSTDSKSGTQLRNLILAIVAILLSAAIAFGLKAKTTPASLDGIAARSVPYEVAIANPKPTFLEFYANWCTSCQAMAQDLQGLKQEYGDQVNFVMLNVDNEKWLPEIVHYRVDGIPHFVYLDPAGESVGETIGEQPKTVIAANLTALSNNQTLPYAQFNVGQTSNYQPPKAVTTKTNTDPRSHGAQVTTQDAS